MIAACSCISSVVSSVAQVNYDVEERLDRIWQTPRTRRGFLTSVDHKEVGKIEPAFAIGAGIPLCASFLDRDGRE